MAASRYKGRVEKSGQRLHNPQRLTYLLPGPSQNKSPKPRAQRMGHRFPQAIRKVTDSKGRRFNSAGFTKYLAKKVAAVPLLIQEWLHKVLVNSFPHHATNKKFCSASQRSVYAGMKWRKRTTRRLESFLISILQVDLKKNSTYFYSFRLKSQSIQGVDSFLCILRVNVVHKAISQALP